MPRLVIAHEDFLVFSEPERRGERRPDSSRSTAGDRRSRSRQAALHSRPTVRSDLLGSRRRPEALTCPAVCGLLQRRPCSAGLESDRPTMDEPPRHRRWCRSDTAPSVLASASSRRRRRRDAHERVRHASARRPSWSAAARTRSSEPGSPAASPDAQLDGPAWTVPVGDLVAAGLLDPTPRAHAATGPRPEPDTHRRLGIELARAEARIAALEELVARQDDELQFLRQLTVDALGQARAELMSRPLTGSIRPARGTVVRQPSRRQGSIQRRQERFVTEARGAVLAGSGRCRL